MQTLSAADSHSRPSKVDIRPSMRVATWNVLTLAHTGYPEAIVNELLNYRVSLAGLTETRFLHVFLCVLVYVYISKGNV